MFKRKKSHKGHINNSKPKKYIQDTTVEESCRTSLLKEYKRKFYEREKILQQKEYELEI